MSTPKPYIICDIDGTISDATHRQHYVQKNPKNWSAFFSQCVYDKPITDIIDLINIFYDLYYKIILVSGRSNIVREQTERWIINHSVPYHKLFMRGDRDYRPDDIIKEEMYLTLIKPWHGEPKYVLDDRDRVVKMWRKHGLRCLQVAPGNF